MKISDKIHEIETENDVSSLKVLFQGKTFQIYPWIKAKLFYKLTLGDESLAKKDQKMFFRQLSLFFYGFFNLFKKYDAWAFSNSEERIEIRGKYFDKIFDGFNEVANFKILLIELQLFKNFKRNKVYSKHIVSKAFFMFQEELISRIFIRKVHIENPHLLDTISTTMGVQVNSNQIIRKVLAQYSVMKFWLTILKNPKLVFVSVGYSNFGYILALKERKIPVIEMQHGVISEGHQAYNYLAELEKYNFPDAIAVWGEDENNFISKKSMIPINQVFAIGRPIIDFYANNAIQNSKIEKICVSLQDAGISDELIQVLLDINSLMPDKYQFYLQRRRTSENEYRKKFVFPPNFHFFKGNIYDNIIGSDIHITVYSTSALESLSLGKPNIFYDSSLKSKDVFFEKIGLNPYCFFINNEGDLTSLLENYSLPSIEAVRKESSRLCALNYKSNLEKLINTFAGTR
ncbi:MAG: hypothetical protein RLZ10_927 [Bacteroidota bacterium]|jgi:hypothetical protein